MKHCITDNSGPKHKPLDLIADPSTEQIASSLRGPTRVIELHFL